MGLNEKGSFLDVLLKFSVLSLSCKWYFFQFLEADLSFMLPEIFERKGEIGEGVGEEGEVEIQNIHLSKDYCYLLIAKMNVAFLYCAL